MGGKYLREVVKKAVPGASAGVAQEAAAVRAVTKGKEVYEVYFDLKGYHYTDIDGRRYKVDQVQGGYRSDLNGYPGVTRYYVSTGNPLPPPGSVYDELPAGSAITPNWKRGVMTIDGIQFPVASLPDG